ncbi:hypothetical protein ACIA49_37165 [Kribbella sp. NPDC051587]|uniref:hypothetical protein n=1 Tax=Kribbella sp. NPDC051587 TaxID=3364119 RepID=UPI0037A35422
MFDGVAEGPETPACEAFEQPATPESKTAKVATVRQRTTYPSSLADVVFLALATGCGLPARTANTRTAMKTAALTSANATIKTANRTGILIWSNIVRTFLSVSSNATPAIPHPRLPTANGQDPVRWRQLPDVIPVGAISKVYALKQLRFLGRPVDPASLIRYESAPRSHVNPVFGRRQLRSIKPSEIAAWVVDLMRGSGRPPRVRRFWCCMGRSVWR